MIFVLVLIMFCNPDAEAQRWCGPEPVYVGADNHPTLEACEKAGNLAKTQLAYGDYSVDFKCLPFTTGTHDS